MNEPLLESVARRLCEIRGEDPDEQVMHGADPQPGSNFVVDICLWFPRWTRCVPELRAHLEREQAIREAIEERCVETTNEDKP